MPKTAEYFNSVIFIFLPSQKIAYISL